MANPRLHLLHLSSPALPVGAYAYSQGLEYAVEAGWVEGDALHSWITDGLHLGIARLDLPVLRRASAAFSENDTPALNRWNDLILANRETRELLLEDQQIGAALWRLLGQLGITGLPALEQPPAYALAFGVAAAAWSIDAEDACAGYCYSWIENQVTAATKLVPLGQSAAQRLLLRILEDVDAACRDSLEIDDEAIGLSLPRLAAASCRHEHQHTRLFRS